MSQATDLLRQFNEVVAHRVGNLPEGFDGLMDKCRLQVSTVTNFPGDARETLLSIKTLLLSDEDIDYDLLLELLSAVLQITRFDAILEAYSMADLEQALKSGISPLIQSACQVIQTSDPKGALASSGLFEILLHLYFDVNTDIAVVKEIDTTWELLMCDDRVRNTILAQNVKLLLEVKEQFKPIPMARLLHLLGIIFRELKTPTEYVPNLFVFEKNELVEALKTDIIMFLNIVKYYSTLLESIAETNHEWALHNLIHSMFDISELFAEREQFPDIVAYGKSFLFTFFRHISYLNDLATFRKLDEKFLHISEGNEFLSDYLSFVNPQYLFDFHKDLIDTYATVSAFKLPILRNMVSNNQTFQLVKPKLTADAILAMAYPEQMVLLQKMSQYIYCVQYLVHNLPKVMSSLIDNNYTPITEPETVDLRTQVIENMLHYEKNVLDAWSIPLQNEYIKLNHGINPERTAATDIATAYIG
ncbi:Hsm3p KNAG_0C01810 [Huiozyma naganishii CBS 8797]|uniref:DNA mismatch repair protein HSM3 n=1 Tax=Huiozyma naganishii (strain ATCC MYA-139 / BCRC 22969 / CBS 8797 / KCTC 17520 / NBRC 10181 / NCYC 3082 / Yp74L-3) TaxID=1071383 RepID=J7R387_HUIN7|nr:hypothetical protein KNAG_0C01810 [Kazachstania naganishii CBS 8797]CCK69295.1 hypothetical protein KNAG_0C01810 [Kazachstania naganishii CBS 8797]